MLLRPTGAPIVANVKPLGRDQKSCGLLIAGLSGKRRTNSWTPRQKSLLHDADGQAAEIAEYLS